MNQLFFVRLENIVCKSLVFITPILGIKGSFITTPLIKLYALGEYRDYLILKILIVDIYVIIIDVLGGDISW